MTRDQAIAKAKKLKALADRGVGGEKQNAKDLLDRLIKKYDLKPGEITGSAGPSIAATYAAQQSGKTFTAQDVVNAWRMRQTGDTEFNNLVKEFSELTGLDPKDQIDAFIVLPSMFRGWYKHRLRVTVVELRKMKK